MARRDLYKKPTPPRKPKRPKKPGEKLSSKAKLTRILKGLYRDE